MTSFISMTMLCGLTLWCKIFPVFSMNVKIFYKIPSIPLNIVMDLNNVMKVLDIQEVWNYFQILLEVLFSFLSMLWHYGRIEQNKSAFHNAYTISLMWSLHTSNCDMIRVWILTIYEYQVGSFEKIGECKFIGDRENIFYIIRMMGPTRDLLVTHGFIFLLTIRGGVVNTLCFILTKHQTKLPIHLNCE